jgi:hypothetical protein
LATIGVLRFCATASVVALFDFQTIKQRRMYDEIKNFEHFARDYDGSLHFRTFGV